ncbi:MAG TPA: hypothetical protein VN622_14865 [Clostridia bacterium]|nr:hypothetical protein [Clostridia bacterium]
MTGFQNIQRVCLAAVLTIGAFICPVAQAPRQPAQQPAPAVQQQPSVSPQTGSPTPLPDPATAPVERTISPAETKELLDSVDEILAFASKDSGLPIKHKVKRQLATREEVVKYLEERLKDDEDAERMERSATTLKKFGLLPRDFNLRPFLLDLLKEQVAGFYDTKTKTVYMLDWVEPEAQKAVLAHELTHALQDQNFGLEKWASGSSKAKNDAESAERDEQRSARQGVIEGQAMVVLLDYTLAPVGKSVADSPQLIEAMKAGMLAGGATPLYSQAPLFLKEALTFPYTYGLDFVREVLTKRGRDVAFTGVLKDPPNSTRQVMQPNTYLARESVPQLAVPDFDKLIAGGYERFDFGSIGQFDVWVMLKTWIGAKTADEHSGTWRGGYYYAAKKAKSAPDAPVAMVYVSRWTDAAAAREYARLYAESLPKRYKSVKQVRALGAEGGQWDTDEGLVVLERRGDTLVASEGFESEFADKVCGVVFEQSSR